MEAVKSSFPKKGSPLSPALIAALVSGPIALALFWLAALAPALVESWYSRGLYAWLHFVGSRLAALIPFPVAEIAGLVVIGVGVGLFFFTPRAWLYDLAGVSVVLAWFVVGWGLNYQRLPWAETAGISVRGGTIAQLEVLAADLTREANLERKAPSLATWQTLVPEAKAALFPGVLSAAGVAGIYIPWTSEPLLNPGPPEPFLTFAAAHEAAHQQGWAREDEANFLAWLRLHDAADPAGRYAAALGALPYVAGALTSAGDAGIEAWTKVSRQLDPGVVADWQSYEQYWKRFQGPVLQAAQAVNDVYLKSQGQHDGVRSYGRMVDLLLAWRNK